MSLHPKPAKSRLGDVLTPQLKDLNLSFQDVKDTACKIPALGIVAAELLGVVGCCEATSVD